jgi:hypothetical protein
MTEIRVCAGPETDDMWAIYVDGVRRARLGSLWEACRVAAAWRGLPPMISLVRAV